MKKAVFSLHGRERMADPSRGEVSEEEVLAVLANPDVTYIGVDGKNNVLGTVEGKRLRVCFVEEPFNCEHRLRGETPILGPGLRKFYWQSGYGAFSVSQSHVEQVRKYILRQEQHHRKKTFQDEFREFLKKYEVDYDERYVWD